jgi:large subunit ribosomal protein L25
MRVGKSSRIDVAIPVHFINEEASPGLKRGGVLNVVLHEIECSCPADAIPESITVDLTGLNIGDSVHISSVKLPEGIKPVITGRNFTVAAVAGSSALKPEAAPDAGAEEAKAE